MTFSESLPGLKRTCCACAVLSTSCRRMRDPGALCTLWCARLNTELRRSRGPRPTRTRAGAVWSGPAHLGTMCAITVPVDVRTATGLWAELGSQRDQSGPSGPLPAGPDHAKTADVPPPRRESSNALYRPEPLIFPCRAGLCTPFLCMVIRTAQRLTPLLTGCV